MECAISTWDCNNSDTRFILRRITFLGKIVLQRHDLYRYEISRRPDFRMKRAIST
ncbi:unnamed protein product [Larinioides sclopetarius]|uniref:Translational initiation factor 1 n=1 Tax=Larinioides sclopetarius TaxID=280406 RepID=A0AAV1YQ12_9ARAC